MIKGRAELLAWTCLPGVITLSDVSAFGILGLLVFIVVVTVAALSIFKSRYFLITTWLALLFLHIVNVQYYGVDEPRSISLIIFSLPILIYIGLTAKGERWKVTQSSF